MKSQARVVIVGGGMLGVSLAYHLTREGWNDVVLVEKGELTSGSTWHAAGLIPNFIASLNVGKIHQESIKLYKELEAKYNSTGWHGCGSLRLATEPDHLEWFKYVKGVGDLIGYESQILSPSEIKEVHPLLVADDAIAGYYTPDDGHTDPTGTLNCLVMEAREAGAVFERHNRVLDISATPTGEWKVSTEKGDITCEHVVNAAGCYGAEVGAFVGLKVPIVNMVHQYLVTENVPEVDGLTKELPVVRDPYSSSYIRQEQRGILIGPYETENSEAWALDGMDWSFDMELLPPDLDRIAPWVEKALERVPCAMNSGIKRIVSGPITHTPDGNFLVGPAKGLKNYWMNCGASIGICQGGGVGKYLAQWMVHGQSEINPRELDPRRFDDWAVGDHAVAKACDEYEHMYSVYYPGEARDAGRPVRTTPIYERLKDAGAVFIDIYGWERAKWFSLDGKPEELSFRHSNWFEPVNAECMAVREKVGIMDLSTFAKYSVTGKDARKFLDRVYTNKVPKRDGGVGLGYMLTESGFIESEVTITHLGNDEFYLLSAAVAEVHDFDWLNQHVESNEDVAIANVTDDYGVLVLTGPRSRDVLGAVTDASLDNANFRWLTAQTIEIAGHPVRALRVSYAGELGWELHTPMKAMPDVYDAVFAAGESHGIVNFGAYALNSLRMEKAYKGWGSELTTEITTIEADCDRFVDFDKDFIGKAALVARQTQEIKTRLVYCEVENSDNEPRGNEPVIADGKIIGVTTSGAWCPAVGKTLAFAYVESEFAAPGSEFSIELLGEKRRASVLAEPAWDPASERLRA